MIDDFMVVPFFNLAKKNGPKIRTMVHGGLKCRTAQMHLARSDDEDEDEPPTSTTRIQASEWVVQT